MGKLQIGKSVARFVPRREPTNPHEGYASLGMRALGFELTPKKFADVRVAIAGEGAPGDVNLRF